MQTHISRAAMRSFWGTTTYRLSVKVIVHVDEKKVIADNNLGRIEVFTDPVAEELFNAADAAHERAKSRGVFVGRASDTAVIAVSEISALVLSARAFRAFNLCLDDLIRGVTIEQRSLREIADIEAVCIDFIDRLAAAVAAATSYTDQTEDVYAPGTEQDDTVPPGAWTRGWRR